MSRRAPYAQATHLEELEDVVPHVKVGEARVEDLEVEVVDVFGDEARDLGRRVAHDIEQCDDVRPAGEVLQDLNLPLNLLLLDRLDRYRLGYSATVVLKQNVIQVIVTNLVAVAIVAVLGHILACTVSDLNVRGRFR